jgi:hypothetical protein
MRSLRIFSARLAQSPDDIATVGGGQNAERRTTGRPGWEIGRNVDRVPGGEHDVVMVEVWGLVLRIALLLDDGELNSDGPGT